MEMKYRNSSYAIDRSPEDEARFGIRVARCRLTGIDDSNRVHEYCRDQAIRLLIARCSTSHLDVVQHLERAGYLLMDTLLYYAFDLSRRSVPDDEAKVTIRFATPEDAGFIEPVARASFQGYFGHYHADPRLDRAQSDETYVSWAVNSVVQCTTADGPHPVLVAEQEGTPVGFLTLRENSPDEGEGVLNSVAPAWQGSGIYRVLIQSFLTWCQCRGMTRAVISTQITNLPVQKVWVRLGMEPSESYYTFHKWFG